MKINVIMPSDALKENRGAKMANIYKSRAIKEKVSGHKSIGLTEDVYEYDSKLEARCAKVLIKAGIRFKPHVKFDCIDKEGKPFTYEVDFLFEASQKMLGISAAIEAIEVKGALKRHDLLRIEALKFKHGIRTFITTEPLIGMWEREGVH